MAQGWKRDYTRYKSFFLNIVALYNSKPSLKIYFELILSLTTIVVFALFAIRPTILTILEINNEIKTKESTITKLEKKISDLQKATNILQNESANLSLINQAVPSESEIDKYISQIEFLASNTGVQITSISSTDLLIKGKQEDSKKVNDLSPLPDNPNEMKLSMSVTGSYPNLLNFMTSVENLRRPIQFDNFILNSTKSTSDEKILTLTITGRVPYLVNNKEIKEDVKK